MRQIWGRGGGIPSVIVAYSAQIELGFLVRVRVWTSVDLDLQAVV